MARAVELSLVIPVYNEEQVLPALFERLHALRDELATPLEFVFVDDGSRDRTRELLLERAARDPDVALVALSRNFGHQVAISAGLDVARGAAVVVMDADLQDPPELVADMYARYREGYDVVYARRRERRGETWFKLATAHAFYWVMRRLVHSELPANVGDFRLMSRPVVETLKELREQNRFMRGLVLWSGFRQTCLDYDRDERAAGETHYPFLKMLALAVDGITSFSYLPMRLALLLGLLVIGVAGGFLSYGLYQYARGVAVVGWTSVVVLIFLLNGVVLVFLGLIGEYVGRIYMEAKARPLYVVASTVNLEVTPGRRASGGLLVEGRRPEPAARGGS